MLGSLPAAFSANARVQFCGPSGADAVEAAIKLVKPAPDAWLQEIRRITQARAIPLIVDEVQTGLGRTGRLYAFEHAGVIPDAVVLSKAIGGGLPLSVVLYNATLDHWAPGAHAGTFCGNQMAMAAGAATLRFIRDNRLDEQAWERGKQLLTYLGEMQRESRSIGDVRGRGLMIGVEVVDTDGLPGRQGGYPPSPAVARRIQAEALRRGLIVELGGRHGSVVRFLPPLIVSTEQIMQIATVFRAAVNAAEDGR